MALFTERILSSCTLILQTPLLASLGALIPPTLASLGALTKLTMLSLESLMLTGTLPSQLGRLDQLLEARPSQLHPQRLGSCTHSKASQFSC